MVNLTVLSEVINVWLDRQRTNSKEGPRYSSRPTLGYVQGTNQQAPEVGAGRVEVIRGYDASGKPNILLATRPQAITQQYGAWQQCK